VYLSKELSAAESGTSDEVNETQSTLIPDHPATTEIPAECNEQLPGHTEQIQLGPGPGLEEILVDSLNCYTGLEHILQQDIIRHGGRGLHFQLNQQEHLQQGLAQGADQRGLDEMLIEDSTGSWNGWT